MNLMVEEARTGAVDSGKSINEAIGTGITGLSVRSKLSMHT